MCFSGDKKKPRAPKTSTRQYEAYLQALENYPHMRNKKDLDDTIQAEWDELTTTLNAAGSGPIKTKREWQKVNACALVYKHFLDL